MILKMSLTAAIVILIVIAIRFFMRKLPKKYTYMLWAAVGFRLLCPVSIESRFSIFNFKPAAKVTTGVERSRVYSNYIRTAVPERHVAHTVQAVRHAGETSQAAVSSSSGMVNAVEKFTAPDPHTILLIIWITVVAAILGYAVYHLIKLKLRMKDARRIEKNVFESPLVASPFAMGIINPGIYLPADLPEGEKEYLIEHERTHIKRGDLIFKMIAVVALAVHWFNPLVWVAFILFCRDMEMSCDEIVLEKLGDGIRKSYSLSLVTLAQNSDDCSYVVMPTSFSKSSVGKTEVKMRITNIMSFKKSSRSVAALAGVSVAAAMLMCVLNGCTTNAIPLDETTETTVKVNDKNAPAASDSDDWSTNGELEGQLDYMVLCSDYEDAVSIPRREIDDPSEIEDEEVRSMAQYYMDQGLSVLDQEAELAAWQSWGDGEYMFKYGFYAYSFTDETATEVWIYKMNETLFDYFMVYDDTGYEVDDDGTIIRYTKESSLSSCIIEYNRDTGFGSRTETFDQTVPTYLNDNLDYIENDDLRAVAESYAEQGYAINLLIVNDYFRYDFPDYPYGDGIAMSHEENNSLITIEVFELDEDMFEDYLVCDECVSEIAREDDGNLIHVTLEFTDPDYGDTFTFDVEFDRSTNLCYRIQEHEAPEPESNGGPITDDLGVIEDDDLRALAQSYADSEYEIYNFDPVSRYELENYSYSGGFSGVYQDGVIVIWLEVFEGDEDIFNEIADSSCCGNEIGREEDGDVVTVTYRNYVISNEGREPVTTTLEFDSNTGVITLSEESPY